MACCLASRVNETKKSQIWSFSHFEIVIYHRFSCTNEFSEGYQQPIGVPSYSIISRVCRVQTWRLWGGTRTWEVSVFLKWGRGGETVGVEERELESPNQGACSGTMGGYYHPTHTGTYVQKHRYTQVKQCKIKSEQIQLQTSCKNRALYIVVAPKKQK